MLKTSQKSSWKKKRKNAGGTRGGDTEAARETSALRVGGVRRLWPRQLNSQRSASAQKRSSTPHKDTHTQVHRALGRVRVCTFELQCSLSLLALIVNLLWLPRFDGLGNLSVWPFFLGSSSASVLSRSLLPLMSLFH